MNVGSFTVGLAVVFTVGLDVVGAEEGDCVTVIVGAADGDVVGPVGAVVEPAVGNKVLG